MWYDQDEFDIRCEWGLNGVGILKPTSEVIIIVDILSFTTSVEIATSRGAHVFPFDTWSEQARLFAREHNAILAEKDRTDLSKYSLSPTSLQHITYGQRLVLPSPNGSSISKAAGQIPTLAACLRNCKAVAEHALSYGSKIAVIPAGEKWEDNTLRFAWEDWIGAGAVIYHLMGNLLLSPEAESAVAAYLAVRNNLKKFMGKCVSGKELLARNLTLDLQLATEYDISDCIPKLENGAYRNIFYEDTFAPDRIDKFN